MDENQNAICYQTIAPVANCGCAAARMYSHGPAKIASLLYFLIDLEKEMFYTPPSFLTVLRRFEIFESSLVPLTEATEASSRASSFAP